MKNAELPLDPSRSLTGLSTERRNSGVQSSKKSRAAGESQAKGNIASLCWNCLAVGRVWERAFSHQQAVMLMTG
ncbi:hypothetical protein ACU4GD_36610 [Cupriavidus basilensis]